MFCCQHYSPFYHIIPYRRKVFTYNCQIKKDIFEPKQNKAGIQSRDIAEKYVIAYEMLTNET